MRKLNLLKRLNAKRLLPSLALCSMTLVVFSAVVYAAAATNTLTSSYETLPFSSLDSSSAGDGSSNGVETGSSSWGAGKSDPSLPTFSSALSLESPSLNAIESEDNSTKSASSSANSGSSSSTDNASSEEASAGESAPVSAAAENAYHAHIAKYYAELPKYYEHLCAGLNNAYAVANSADREWEKVNVSPVNASNIIQTIDKKRAEAQRCTYNGKEIPAESKWYGEYNKVWRLYENLVNTASIIREINGQPGKNARKSLDYYSNSNGKIRELATFEQNYPTVHL